MKKPTLQLTLAGLEWITARSTRLGIRACDLVAWVTSPLRRHGWRDAETLFPGIGRRAGSRIMRRAIRRGLRDKVISRLSVGHPAQVRKLVRVDEKVASLKGPVILATVHTGPIHAFGVIAPEIWPAAEAVRAYGQNSAGAAAIASGISRLREGAVVYLAVDVAVAAQVPVRYCGQSISLARGAFAMSRITGAPIVPLLFVWRGHHIEAVAGEPIDPAAERAPRTDVMAFESALANRYAAWLERYFTDHPQDAGIQAMKLLGRVEFERLTRP